MAIYAYRMGTRGIEELPYRKIEGITSEKRAELEAEGLQLADEYQQLYFRYDEHNVKSRAAGDISRSGLPKDAVFVEPPKSKGLGSKGPVVILEGEGWASKHAAALIK